MAERSSRSRPDPVARFNTFEVPENEIKAQLVTAQRAQRALRARSFWLPRPTHNSGEENEPQLSASSGKPPPAGFSSQSEPSNVDNDVDGSSLDRTFSFNSLSTQQRTEEAARLSQYRDSPVSACMTDRIPVEAKISEQDPCPPLSVYTLKQARKDDKELKKSLKKLRLQHNKSGKPGAEVNTPKDKHDGTSSPRRTVSDPSYRRPKDFASQLIRRLKTNKPVKLAHRPRSSPVEVPHLDDFDSKATLQGYLNASTPETVAVEQPPNDIAELPGSLPPAYTPYHRRPGQPSSAALPTAAEYPIATQVQRSSSVQPIPSNEFVSKMMRCDNCQFGIKHQDHYLQCRTCNGGDRIICDACDAAGFSCRHQLVRQTRHYLQVVDGVYRGQPSLSPSRGRREQTRRSTAEPTQTINQASVYDTELDQKTGTPKRSDAHIKALDHKAHELQKREQDLLHREREATLQEREGMLRVREAEVAAKARQSESSTNTDFMRSCMEMAVSLGTQFANMSRSTSNASTAPPSPAVPRSFRSSEPYFAGLTSQQPSPPSGTDDSHIRAHGVAKRKAGGGAGFGRSASGDKRNASQTPVHAWNDGNGDDADEPPAGTPKKLKQEGDHPIAGETLYACHYCKHDPSRYSDRNTQEKWYRSCSSGYWPDISRLKQHLYRVHWRGKYCGQCHVVFKTDEELNEHRQWLDCEPKQCPSPEKFDMDVHAEIKKKRPQQSADQVWYTLWDILFPGTPRPNTPYADRSNENHPRSPSSLATEPQRQALEQLFENRLSQADQAWMTPEMRAFVQDQLRESMADLIRRTQPSQSPAAEHTPSQHLSAGPSRPRLSIPEQPSISSVATSPQPVSALSATSTCSTSSARWHHLSSHRRSFSRPLPSRTSRSSIQLHEERGCHESALTSAVDTTPSEYIFNVRTPADPETDGWDPASNSWQQGDELGLAVSTDSFAFPFNDENKPASQYNLRQTTSDVPLSSFQPVQLQSLTEPQPGISVPTQLRSKLPSEASVDSGYGSMHSRNRYAPCHAGMPVAARGGWAPQPSLPAVAQAEDEAIALFNEPVPESQINYGALDMSFAEFTDGGPWEASHVF